MDLVKSEEFRSLLAEAAQITMRTGHETAFSYVRYLEAGTNHFSPVFEGLTDTVPLDDEDEWEENEFPPDASLAKLVDLHLHPQTDGPLGLSPQDIRNIDQCDVGYDISPVVGIGTINQRARGYVLLLQKDFPGYLKDSSAVPQQLSNNYRQVEYRWPSSDFGRLIEIAGFVKADVLRFRLPGGRASAHVVNPKVMARFGYQVTERKGMPSNHPV